MFHLIEVPSGTVRATHSHPTYGPCIILGGFGTMLTIRTSTGTALVPARTLVKLIG